MSTPKTLDNATRPASAAAAPAKVISELQGVGKSFAAGGGQSVAVLRDVSLQLRAGEFVAVLGQSGSGKSTLLRILAGLVTPTTGRVLRHGVPLRGFNTSVAIVFQTFALYPWLTVTENVRVGLTRRRVPRAEEDAEIERAVRLIGLSGYENAYPKECSGGMRQRVGFARALVAQPEILCMDEPFSALDVFTAENMRREVLSLWRGKRAGFTSVMLITHNIEEAVFLADRIVVMGSHPGHVREIVTNDVPSPRDARSASFQRLVRRLHDVIVSAHLPEAARPEPATPLGVPKPQPVPAVNVGEIFGLLSVVADRGGEMDVFAVDQLTDYDFGHTLAVIKAGEMLDFLETPQNQVVVTDLGREVLGMDVNDRKRAFRERISGLPTFRFVLQILNEARGKTLSGEVMLEELVMHIPADDPEPLFNTVVSWGRFAELFVYDADAETFSLEEPHEEGAPATQGKDGGDGQ